MLRSFCAVIILILCLTYKVNAEFPEDLKPCKYGDTECLIKTIDHIFHEKNQGDNSIGLVKLDPMHAKKVVLKQGGESPVNIDLTFTNSSIYGLSQAKVLKISGFGKDIKQEHEIVIKVKSLQQIGAYKVNGKVLILPIQGSGESNITMVNAVLTLKFVGTPVEKDGATYMKVDQFVVDCDPERIILKIDNLFNGDKVLGDNMNLFLNENWSDIYRELRSSLAIAYGKIFKGVISKVFAKYPYDKYFIE